MQGGRGQQSGRRPCCAAAIEASMAGGDLRLGGGGALFSKGGGCEQMGGIDGCGSGILPRSVTVWPWPAGGVRRTGEGWLEAPCRRADGGPRLHGKAPFESTQL